MGSQLFLALTTYIVLTMISKNAYGRVDKKCHLFARCHYYRNTEISTEDTAEPDVCQRKCLENADCKSFSWSRRTRSCNLYSDVNKRNARSENDCGQCFSGSFTEEESLPPLTENPYELLTSSEMADKDCAIVGTNCQSGYDALFLSQTTMTVENCKAICTEAKDCHAFSRTVYGYCWLYRKIRQDQKTRNDMSSCGSCQHTGAGQGAA